ncbi:hypothetical protein ACHAXA_006470 [Cyclostephanos tholiformis]|uniref:LMBR1-like membrane protein n=1 Tax=Cyclostephanos tholiformis TaxID=382380 RepID=A0ABD3RZE6_9STRA
MGMEESRTLLPLAIILFATSTWFVIHHAKRGTSFVVVLLSIASFGLGSAAVALLPIDLSYASSSIVESDGDNGDLDNDEDGGTDPTTTAPTHNPTYLSWRVTYWATFFLAWLVLPIVRETLLSGHFVLHRRLRDGAYRSFRSILLMLCFGVLSVIGMAVHLRSLHLVAVVLPVLMALSNTYGLLLVSLLLGNGLVNIPKRLWRMARPANELRRVRIVSCGAEEELFDSVMALEDVEDRIEEVCRAAVCLREENASSGLGGGLGGVSMMEDVEDGEVGPRIRRRWRWCIGTSCTLCAVDEVTEFHECLEVLVRRKNETADLCSERRTRSRTGGGSRGCGGSSPRRCGGGGRCGESDDAEDADAGNDYGGGEINTMDITYLVHLNGQLKMAQERVTSAQLRWNHLMEHSRLFSALMEDDYNYISDEHPSYYRKLQHHLQRLWVRYLRYPTYRCVSLITAVLSIFVLLSEVTLAAPLNLSPFSWTLHALDKYYHHENSSTRILFQISALVPLLYMSVCVYACLFQMSLMGPYCLRGNRQSTGVALVFNAQYLVRLQFPLGYNYLLMLKYDMTHCAFNAIMNDMSTIPFFGTSFTVYAPLAILAVCLFTLCDFYPRILRFLGIEHEDALLLGDVDELDGKVNEGIQLMKRDAERMGMGSSLVGGSASPEKQSLNERKSNIIV